jgi:F0F1-type ATP synthase assembly protein I
MKREKSLMAMVGDYTALAMVLPISTFIGYAMGYGLDKLFHTHFLYIVFLILGTVSGLVQVIRQLLRDTSENGS